MKIDDRDLERAIVAGEIVRRLPGLSAAGIAAEHNREAGMLFGNDAWSARTVRQLVWIARERLLLPIIARPGGSGYRWASTPAELRGHALQCRRQTRDYLALARASRRSADALERDQGRLGLRDAGATPVRGHKIAPNSFAPIDK